MGNGTSSSVSNKVSQLLSTNTGVTTRCSSNTVANQDIRCKIALAGCTDVNVNCSQKAASSFTCFSDTAVKTVSEAIAKSIAESEADDTRIFPMPWASGSKSRVSNEAEIASYIKTQINTNCSSEAIANQTSAVEFNCKDSNSIVLNAAQEMDAVSLCKLNTVADILNKVDSVLESKGGAKTGLNIGAIIGIVIAIIVVVVVIAACVYFVNKKKQQAAMGAVGAVAVPVRTAPTA